MAALPPIVMKITATDDGATATLEGVTAATTKNAQATNAAGAVAKEAAPNVGQFGSAVGLAGQAVGKLNPALGGLVTMAGSSLGAIQALTVAGMGPLGVAVAGLSIAVAAGTAIMQSFDDAQREAAVGVGILRTGLLDAASAFDDLAAARTRDQQAASRGAALALGNASTEQAATEITRLERAIDAQRLTNFRGENDRQISQLEDRLAMVREGAAAAEVATSQQAVIQSAKDQQVLEEQKRQAARSRGGRGGRAASGGAPLSDENAQFQLEADLARANAANADATFNRLGGDGGDDFLKQLAQEREDELEIEQNHYERMRELTESELEKRRAIEEENAAQLQEINDSVFSAVESGLKSSVDAWLSGSATIGEAAMNMARGTAKALASEAIVEGLKQTALGIGNSIFNPPAAAANFASAATWAAVGVAAGALGAATGAFGAQGGGASSAAASPQAGPALDGGATERGGDVYNINWGSAGLVYAADKAQLGRDLEDLIAGSRSRLGRAA